MRAFCSAALGVRYKVLLAEELMGNWESPTLAVGSAQEAALLAETVTAVSDGGSDAIGKPGRGNAG